MQPINASPSTRRKDTQRERLLNGAITVANRDGCSRANVSAIITAAGVSRPTFYEYFTDRGDCLLATLADIHERLLADVKGAVRSQAPARAVQSATTALVEFASTQPARARFLMSESMAAGPSTLDARDQGIAEIERAIEAVWLDLPAASTVPDVCPRVVIGAVYRLLALRLRRGEPRVSAILHELIGWIDRYARPAEQHRWRTLEPAPAPQTSPFLPNTPMRAPRALRPGRPRLTEQQVAANHRQRILFAAAQLAERKGYAATTIAEITKLARVDGRVFYSLFTGKQDAFMTVHELGFQEIMAVTAGAFFAGASWPERSWEAGRAFTQFLEQNPTVAHVGFVEAYAVGPGAIQRVEDTNGAFTIFLQEGYQYAPREDQPSRLALEAIIATIFEIAYHQARASTRPQLAGLLAHMTFLWLTPFVGPADADAFIDRQVAATER